MMGLDSGQLFANPIPHEFEIPKSEIANIITRAVDAATLTGITGKDNTPFILNRIKEETKGRSLPANRALVLDNVRVGAKIAVELSKMEGSAGRIGF